MPHIIVEHSSTPDLDMPALLKALHDKIGDHPDVKKEFLKTRAIAVQNALVGEDEANNEMLHITLRLLPRPEDMKQEMALELQQIARSFAPETCSITVETVELDAHTYCK